MLSFAKFILRIATNYWLLIRPIITINGLNSQIHFILLNESKTVKILNNSTWSKDLKNCTT